MEFFDQAFLSWIGTYKYLIVFILAIAEGPVIMTISGFFLRIGEFSFWPLYLTLMAGDLAADTLWYAVGYHWGRPFIEKYGKFVSISQELVQKTENAFHRHQNKILFLSKITMGLGFALVILITAGIAKIPFRKYIIFNLVGQFVWTGALILVGYSFGNLYLTINEGLRDASLIAFILLAIAAVYGVSRYLRERDVKNTL